MSGPQYHMWGCFRTRNSLPTFAAECITIFYVLLTETFSALELHCNKNPQVVTESACVGCTFYCERFACMLFSESRTTGCALTFRPHWSGPFPRITEMSPLPHTKYPLPLSYTLFFQLWVTRVREGVWGLPTSRAIWVLATETTSLLSESHY